MTAAQSPTIHASAVLVGARAILIRGASGAGKSQLALRLLQHHEFAFTRLVGDDRVHVAAAHGRLVVRPAAALIGLIEIRGLGIRQQAFEPAAVVGLVVDLAADADRLPDPSGLAAVLEGVRLPRVAVAAQNDPLPLVLASLTTP